MKTKRNKLFGISLFLVILCLLVSCARETPLPAFSESDTALQESSPVLLKESADMGQSYLDSFIFLGESTTYHLIHRGVLRGGKRTTQVWGPDNGTINLDSTVTSLRIRYPDTGELLTIKEAAARKRPTYLVLTFGLNGAPRNVRLGKEYYKSVYRLLLDEIRAASPDTKILLQSCFPVAENMDMSNYSVTVEGLNDCIDTINGWVLELAEEYGLRYLNTAEVLTNERGMLCSEFQNGDGHHLTREAYVKILHYIRTHGYR